MRGNIWWAVLREMVGEVEEPLNCLHQVYFC